MKSWFFMGAAARQCRRATFGRSGEDKSFLTTRMAARVSTGSPWPDGTECQRGSVILISAEDDSANTIRPRMDAHCADVRQVHLRSMVRRVEADGERHDVMFTLADLAALEAAEGDWHRMVEEYRQFKRVEGLADGSIYEVMFMPV